MKLVNIKTNQTLVDFQNGKAIFSNKFLEHEMESLGIPIPPGMRSFFEGRDCVFLEDLSFEKAFREVYFLTSMDPSLFEWRDS